MNNKVNFQWTTPERTIKGQQKGTNFQSDMSTQYKSPNPIKQFDDVSAFHITDSDILINLIEIAKQNKKNITQEQSQLQNLFKSIDKEQKQYLTLEDLNDYFFRIKQPQNMEDLIELIKMLDKNRSGVITLKDIQNYMDQQYQ